MEDFVPFELAKKLKEKGFSQDIQHCIGWYPTEYYKNSCIGEYFEGELQEIEDYFGDRISAIHIIENENKGVVAPTISQVLKWVRENNKLHISTKPYPCEDGVMWQYEIRSFSPALVCVIVNKTGFQKPEQADLAGIEHVIENLI